jgi:hypothetical protein
MDEADYELNILTCSVNVGRDVRFGAGTTTDWLPL